MKIELEKHELEFDRQLSPFLMDNFNTLDLTKPINTINKRKTIQAFIDYIKFLTDLGWMEHTGDWDPYITLRFNNGRIQQYTEHGYYEMELTDDNMLKIEDINEDEDDPEDTAYCFFNIDDIQSITIDR
jgi:hypothetical protein